MRDEDQVWLSQTVLGLHGARTSKELADALLSCIGRRFDLPAASVEEVAANGAHYTVHGLLLKVSIPRDYVAHISDHPVFDVLPFLPPVWSLSASVAKAKWEKTDCFNGVARPMGYFDQVIVRAQGAPRTVALSLYRDRRFTEDEMALLAALQPHLESVWRAIPGERNGGVGFSRGTVEIRNHRSPAELSARDFALFRLYFPEWKSAARLPEEVERWMVACHRALRAKPPGQTATSFIRHSGRGTLILNYVPPIGSGCARLRVLENLPQAGFHNLHRCGLSPRECEILGWVAAGKRDDEIAIITRLATATVSRHVFHILMKLRAANRVVAMATARRMLFGSDEAEPLAPCGAG